VANWSNIRRCLLPRCACRRWMVLLALVILLGLGHPLILRILTWPLTEDDSSTDCDYYCVRGGELGADGFEPFDSAARWYHEQGGRKILLLLPHQSRIVEIGAVPSFEQSCRSELGKRGVPPADLVPILADALNVWDEAHALSAWLKEHPAANVRFACNSLGGGRLRYVFNKVLDPADAHRVHMATLEDPSLYTRSWWRTRTGVKDFMYAWLELAYAWVYPDNSRPRPARAGRFQEEVRASIGEAPP
jgi:hypothetical protein